MMPGDLVRPNQNLPGDLLLWRDDPRTRGTFDNVSGMVKKHQLGIVVSVHRKTTVITVTPPVYWCQIVFGDVLGWATNLSLAAIDTL